MKKYIVSLFLTLFCFTSFTALLTGCGCTGSDDTESSTNPPANAENTVSQGTAADASEPGPGSSSDALPAANPSGLNTASAFPKTEPFIDDTGKSMQRDGDYLYSYYDGRLMRTYGETRETALLYQTSPNSRLRFCLYEDSIYFVERAGYDSPDDRDTALYRIEKDGSGLTLLQDDILNAAPMKFITYFGEGKYNINEYDIDIYDNIIYLLNYTYQHQSDDETEKNGNLYFQLENGASVKEISEEDTLYGRVPEGFSVLREQDSPMQSDFPSLPYFMRNYGYLFLKDSQDILWRVDPVSGLQENLHIAVKDPLIHYAFSSDAVLSCSYSGADLFLFDLSDKIMTPVHSHALEDALSSAFLPAEQGFYYCGKYDIDSSGEETVSYFFIYHILSDGSQDSLLYRTLPDEHKSDLADTRYDSCLLGDYFYYFSETETEHSLMRLSLNEYTEQDSGHEIPLIDPSYSWPAYGVSDPADLTVEEREETIEPGDLCSISYSIKELLLKEQSAADRRINEHLIKEAYTDFENYIEDTIQNEQHHFAQNPDYYERYGAYSVDLSLTASCEYMDEDTVSFSCLYYEYFSDTVHSSHWNRYYTFDRHTGRRLSFEDFVDDPELIISAGSPYLEKAAGDWGYSTEYFFDPDRFSLSADGYTLHFSPYEIGPYAAGHITVTIPYEAFEKEL